jgi:hypothetical protein
MKPPLSFFIAVASLFTTMPVFTSRTMRRARFLPRMPTFSHVSQLTTFDAMSSVLCTVTKKVINLVCTIMLRLYSVITASRLNRRMLKHSSQRNVSEQSTLWTLGRCHQTSSI